MYQQKFLVENPTSSCTDIQQDFCVSVIDRKEIRMLNMQWIIYQNKDSEQVFNKILMVALQWVSTRELSKKLTESLEVLQHSTFQTIEQTGYGMQQIVLKAVYKD